MITQALKRWLHKIFGWLSGKPADDAEYARARTPTNTSMTSESLTRPAIEGGTTPPSGVAPLIFGQGETSCSTLNEWSERPVQGPSTPPSSPGEKIELPSTPPSVPNTPPAEMTRKAKEHMPMQAEAVKFDTPPPTPTPEQKLEFLHYLVKRGIVNEGFAEGQIPKQYRSRN